MSSIKIDSLTSTGEGVGSLGGMKVFVDGALPGENVEIEITEEKKTYAKAQLTRVLSPSSERTQPICPLFGACGGCQIMHLEYPGQLRVKRQRVEDALTRIGGLENVEVLHCLPSPHPLGYRNKIQLPLKWEKGKKMIGLYRKQSHEIIPVEKCYIHCPLGEEIYRIICEKLTLPTVRYALIRTGIFESEALVIFVTTGESPKELHSLAKDLMQAHPAIKGVVESVNTRSDNVILGNQLRTLAGRPFIYEKLLSKTFKISPGAFFQVNSHQAQHLFARAIALADIQPQDIVWDAFCGVGTLALFAADLAKHVYGTECVSSATRDAAENCRLNGQEKQCTFICGRAEELIHRIPTTSVVFLNPPRKGCEPPLLAALIKKAPPKLVYISCDPATLARDLSTLSSRYTIDTVQPLDMFPQTMHVETLVRCTAR